METIRPWLFDQAANTIVDAKAHPRCVLADLPPAYSCLIAHSPVMKAEISASMTVMTKILSKCLIDMIDTDTARRKLPVLAATIKKIDQVVEKTAKPDESDWIFKPINGMILTAAAGKRIGQLGSHAKQSDGYLIAHAPQMRSVLVDLKNLAECMHAHLRAYGAGQVSRHGALYQAIRRLGNPLTVSQDVLAGASGLTPFRMLIDLPADNGAIEVMQ